MFHRDLYIVSGTEAMANFLSHRNGTMLSSGTPYRKRCVGLVFLGIAGQHRIQDCQVALEKLLRFRLPFYAQQIRF